MANKRRICYNAPAVGVRSGRVSITDTDGVTRTAEVTASTLYEAVVLGLKAIRGHDWVAGLNEQFGTVRVAMTSIPVEHTVKLKDFTAWLERTAGRRMSLRATAYGRSCGKPPNDSILGDLRRQPPKPVPSRPGLIVREINPEAAGMR